MTRKGRWEGPTVDGIRERKKKASKIRFQKNRDPSLSKVRDGSRSGDGCLHRSRGVVVAGRAGRREHARAGERTACARGWIGGLGGIGDERIEDWELGGVGTER